MKTGACVTSILLLALSACGPLHRQPIPSPFPNLLGRGAKASGLARFGGARNLVFAFRDAWHPTEKWHRCCFELEGYHRERQNALDHFREASNEVTLQHLYNLTERIHLGQVMANVESRSSARR